MKPCSIAAISIGLAIIAPEGRSQGRGGGRAAEAAKPEAHFMDSHNSGGLGRSDQAMVRLNNLMIDPPEAKASVKYLSSSHGLAPEEARPVCTSPNIASRTKLFRTTQ